ncbi:dehydrogenase/reductase SDR family member 4 [Schistocerca americana]|uniref:dehydrogenase/reductase SDR family member 4 n=1 Tax=Schistocerca americana TaxID=7009 RepID=UPI001F4F2A7E|nr:dehydrogenase/reductase SDR family member 4 [Schistocerca americana]XP_049956690.1 dehydrogenase/reductase SDR family member 4 [Schistocerca serialis cubense]
MWRSAFRSCNSLRNVYSPTVHFNRTAAMGHSDGKLKGKVAVVTASTDGIGFAIAKRLAREGAKVVVSSRKQNNVDNAVAKLKAEGHTVTGVTCHVSKASDRQNLLKVADSNFGGIDIIVSNAAVNPTVSQVLECPEEVWDKIFEVNVKAAFLLSKEALPYLRKRGGGSIIYISSIAGYQPLGLLGAYSVSKTALLGLTKAASVDLAKDNIRVNCVAPGIVKTRFSSALYESEETNEITLSQIPMRRLAHPDEISGIVSFLCSEDASYITGETIIASGGMPSRL